jgi:hypothetical protein
MNELAKVLFVQGNAKSFGLGLGWSEKAVEAAKEVGDVEAEVEGLYMCARFAHALGDFERRNGYAQRCVSREAEIQNKS